MILHPAVVPSFFDFIFFHEHFPKYTLASELSKDTVQHVVQMSSVLNKQNVSYVHQAAPTHTCAGNDVDNSNTLGLHNSSQIA